MTWESQLEGLLDLHAAPARESRCVPPASAPAETWGYPPMGSRCFAVGLPWARNLALVVLALPSDWPSLLPGGHIEAPPSGVRTQALSSGGAPLPLCVHAIAPLSLLAGAQWGAIGRCILPGQAWIVWLGQAWAVWLGLVGVLARSPSGGLCAGRGRLAVGEDRLAVGEDRSEVERHEAWASAGHP